MHTWVIDISSSSMCILYRLYKKHLDFEKYLTISGYRDRVSLTKFRCANSKLPVYDQMYMYTTDKCTLCDLNVRGDEYHYILICPFFKQNREMYLKRYYYYRPSLLKFEQLFNSHSASSISKLAKFVKIILACF